MIPLKRTLGTLAFGLAVSGLAIFSNAARADDVVKADNLDNLNLGTSWTNGTPPTASDVAVWDATVATAVPQTLLLGADANWGGIRIIDPAGAVTISAGNTLTLGASGVDTSLASQPLTLACPVTIGAPQPWNLATGVTLSGGLNGADILQKTGAGTLTLASGAGTATIQIDSGIVQVNTSGGSITNALNGGTVNINAAVSNPIHVMAGGGTEQNVGGNRTWSGPLSGSGPLTVVASSTHTWSGNNSGYTGTITLQGSGALRLSSANAVSAGAAYIFNGGTMNPNTAGPFNLGSLAGTGFLNPGAGRDFAVGFLNADTTFSGVIGGAGSIIKVGSGTLTLDGENTHAGGTVISNGVLQIGNFGTSGSVGTGPVTNYAALVFNRADTFTVANAITGAGSVSNIYVGKAVLSGANTYSGPTFVTSGTLAFGSSSAVAGDITVVSGATLGAVVTTVGATATEGNVNFGSFCNYEFDLGTFGNPTATIVSNTGTVTLNGDVTVNVLGDAQFLSVGTFTLLEYGARSGSGNFVQGTLPVDVTGTVNDDTANNRVTLTITSIAFVDPTLQYVGDSAGVWDSDNAANPIWKVVGTGQTTNFYFNAAALFDDSATGTTNIDIVTSLFPESVTVSNSAKLYTFGGLGTISGATGLTKQGDGTLVVTNANDYTGLTSIEEGVIRVSGETASIGGGGVTNNGALIIDRTAATNFVPNTLMFFGQITGAGSLTFLGADKTNSILEVEVGTADGNPYSGGTTISNGYVRLNANPVSNETRSAAKSTGLGAGTITFLGDSILELEDYGVANNSSQAGNFATPLNVPVGQTGELRTAGRMTVSSTLTGAGMFNLGVTYIRDDIAADFSAFTGQVNVNSFDGADDFRVDNTAGWPLARLHVSDGVTMQSITTSGSVIPVGELSASEGATIGFGNNVTWRVGGLNTDATCAANISSANVSFIKEGTGIWTLAGTNLDFTGSTIISNGVLALTTNLVGDTGISNSAVVSVASPGILDVSTRTDGTFALGAGAASQTLQGDGTIRGSLLVGSLGTVTPGFSIGTLTVTNSVTLGGSTVMEMDRSGSPNSDRIVSPAIIAGGTLVVTNIGVALQAGDTFQLFSTAVSGAFASVELPTNDVVNNVNYTWNNNLAGDGTISVATVTSGINTTPTNIIFSAAGGALNLSWPDHLGWILQSQTNALGVGLSTNWVDVLGSESITATNITLDAASPAAFYRLRLP